MLLCIVHCQASDRVTCHWLERGSCGSYWRVENGNRLPVSLSMSSGVPPISSYRTHGTPGVLPSLTDPQSHPFCPPEWQQGQGPSGRLDNRFRGVGHERWHISHFETDPTAEDVAYRLLGTLSVRYVDTGIQYYRPPVEHYGRHADQPLYRDTPEMAGPRNVSRLRGGVSAPGSASGPYTGPDAWSTRPHMFDAAVQPSGSRTQQELHPEPVLRGSPPSNIPFSYSAASAPGAGGDHDSVNTVDMSESIQSQSPPLSPSAWLQSSHSSWPPSIRASPSSAQLPVPASPAHDDFESFNKSERNLSPSSSPHPMLRSSSPSWPPSVRASPSSIDLDSLSEESSCDDTGSYASEAPSSACSWYTAAEIHTTVAAVGQSGAGIVAPVAPTARLVSEQDNAVQAWTSSVVTDHVLDQVSDDNKDSMPARCDPRKTIKRTHDEIEDEDEPTFVRASKRTNLSASAYIGAFAMGTAVGAIGTVAGLAALAPK